MGLSDEERYSGIAYVVDELSSLKPFRQYEFEAFNPILQSLWLAFLGESSNGTHWLLGSDSHQNKLDGLGLFSAAMMRAKSELLEDVVFQKDDQDDDGEDDEEDDPSDAWLKYQKEFAPDALKFLSDQRDNSAIRPNEDRDVFFIYRMTENYFYRANRYPDEFAEKLRPLTDKMCQLQGLCYHAFSTNPVFLKAWMAGNIFEKILTYDSKDMVNQWFKKYCLHHYVSLDNLDNQFIWDTFKQYQKENPNLQSRFEVVLKFVGRQYHYKDSHEDLFKMIEEHNKGAEEKIDLDKIKALCQENADKHTKYEKEMREGYSSYCHLTEQEL